MRKWKCKHCGYCCTLRVRLSFKEYLKILLLGYKNFTEKDGLGRRCIKLPDDKCFFLTKKNNKPFCKIYKHRPKMCREYPGLEYGTCKPLKQHLK